MRNIGTRGSHGEMVMMASSHHGGNLGGMMGERIFGALRKLGMDAPEAEHAAKVASSAALTAVADILKSGVFRLDLHTVDDADRPTPPVQVFVVERTTHEDAVNRVNRMNGGNDE